MPSPLFLLAALLGLTIGPAMMGLWPDGGPWRGLIDGLSRALVGGLCLLMLLPHAVEEAGLPVLLVALVGAAVPLALHRREPRVSRLGGAVALAVLATHAAMDGAALAMGRSGAPALGLGLAVAAHRLPVGLVVYSTATELEGGRSGARLGWAAIGLLMVATGLGYLAAPVTQASPELLHGVLEGLVAGALLHVVVHSPGGTHNPRRWTLTGAAVGLALVLALEAFATA